MSIREADGLVLADSQVAADLRTFISRARSADDGGAVRMQAQGQILAAYVCILRPALLGEATPTVLGLRTMPLARVAEVDRTVALAAVADRLARDQDEVNFSMPPAAVAAGWAGVLPSRSGWERRGILATESLAAAAQAGIREVGAALPARAGGLLVNNLRASVWGRVLEGSAEGLPAGAAFGAFALGFLDPGQDAQLYRQGRWLRVSTPRGHILVRAAAVL